MPRYTRPLQLGALAIAAASLAACSGVPLNQPVATYPTATYPTVGTAPVGSTAPMGTVWGRVTNIEYVPPGTAPAGNQPNVLGAVVGGAAGALLGRQIGGGSGRDVATVLGGLGGAVAGSQYGGGRAAPQAATGPAYRVTVQTDQGGTRTYEVGATGDLRVGDRVRIDNGVIYRA